MSKSNNVTKLLQDLAGGKKEALNALIPQVYDELHRIARNAMNKERASHTLQPTALLNEVFLKLNQGKAIDFQDRAHFFAISATIMRRVLIDHAKAAGAEKRGGGRIKIEFDERFHAGSDDGNPDLEQIDALLNKLAEENPRHAKVVELRYFAGLSIEETATALEVSVTSVKRDWAAAKLWLYRELHKT